MDLSQFLGQKLKDAIQHHQIIYLKDHNTTLIRIVDLPKLWLNNQDLYYLINNYVVGNVETLITFKSLEAELDSAITGYNYEQSEVFNNKLKEYDLFMIQSLKENQQTSGQTITDLLSTPRKPNQQSNTKAILDKLSKMPFGYYMDVSDINKLKYLKGTKNKFVAPNIRIISTNYDNFNYVINQIPQGTTKYAEDLQKAQVYFSTKQIETTKPAVKANIEEGVPIKTVKQSAKYKREQTFLQKLNALGQNKYLDVSHMDNKGQSTVVVDKTNIMSHYYIATDVNITSSNYDHFIQAIEMIPNGDIKYAGDVVLAKIFFNVEEEESEES
jgi:hypothetical protein